MRGFATKVSWSHIQRSRPELARALVRASYNGLIAVPQGARVLDEHRQPLQVEDWVAILSGTAGLSHHLTRRRRDGSDCARACGRWAGP